MPERYLAEAVTMSATPEPTRLGVEAIYLPRRPHLAISPGIGAAQWRGLVAKAPIVRNCISTLILQLTSVPRVIIAEDPKIVDYYLSVLDHFNGEDFNTAMSRIVRDILEVPFGGAIEVVRGTKKEVTGLFHVDGGSLYPTYDPELPFVQVDPTNSLRRVEFTSENLIRLPWLMRSDLSGYGWSITPCMDCLSAIESLVRSDLFYHTLLDDTPPPGILDLLDMREEEARAWAKSFRETFEGVDRFKIPILYEHTQPANWIQFQDTSVMKNLPELIRRYAEIVCSSFGMSIVDLGLYEYSQTKAGSVAQLQASKRQGLGALMAKVADAFNARILPDDVEFRWDPIDVEDAGKKATAQKTRIEIYEKVVAMGILNASQARAMIAAEGILDIDESMLKEMEKAEEEAAKQTAAAEEEAAKAAEEAAAVAVEEPADEEIVELPEEEAPEEEADDDDLEPVGDEEDAEEEKAKKKAVAKKQARSLAHAAPRNEFIRMILGEA